MTVVQTIDCQPAWILHSYDYRDSSRIIRFLTRDHGLVSGIGRGMRHRAKRQKSDVGQIFQPLIISLRGRSELLTITQLDVSGVAVELSPANFLNACYLNELVLSVLASHDEHASIYDDYSATLQALPTASAPESLMRVFEKRLLALIGYGLNLDHDMDGEQIQSDRDYHYRIEAGATRLVAGYEDGVSVSGETLLALKSEQLESRQHNREAKQLLHNAYQWHLRKSNFKVRQVWQQLKNLKHSDSTEKSS
ncbi:MAG: DNA repair protein RecO [Gammaproteobacteria bacterium]|nr:DNA repair protein RecO [Gammaproteobacteria bacterium]